MDNPKINQVVKYNGKRFKVVKDLGEDRFQIKCMVCGGKYVNVHKNQIEAA